MKRFWSTKEGRRILYVVAGIMIFVIGRIVFLQADEMTQEVTQAQRSVSVVSVFDLANDRLPLPVVGRVESQSEAIIRTEVSGEIARVTKSFGDRVRAGEVIAEMNNSAQRAEVLRAQGGLQAAQASLLKLESGSDESKTLIRESVRSAYTTADDAVRNKADQLITDANTRTPDITVASSDYFVRQEAERKRADLNSMFDEWTRSLASLNTISNTEALVVYVLSAQSNLEQVRDFLDDMAVIVAGYEPNDNLSQGTIDKWRSDISVARSSVNSSLNALISSYNSLSSQIASTTGGGEDLLAAQAQVTQAEAGVLAAQAQLEKTIIRSPISGEVNQIDVKQGDFVNAFQEVAVVANNSALEIITYINEEDRKVIQVGSQAQVEGGYEGVVTRISPAVNRQTGKIEVAIGVDQADTLTNGQSVSVDIERTGTNASQDGVITIPITALKITATGNFVFTVDAQQTLVAKPVNTGAIIGEKIIITDGLVPTDQIVLDARGLSTGEQVTIE